MSRGATVLPLENGLNPGVAFLAPSVVCNAGEVSQTIEMPSFDSAEPFIAEVTYRAQNVHGLGVGFGRAIKTLPATEDWQTIRFCLGESAYGPSDAEYGGSVKLRVTASERTVTCPDDTLGRIEVDRLWIDVAQQGECPKPGEVLNGAAEAGDRGWIFEGDPSKAALMEGVGRNGTGGAALVKAEGGATSTSMAAQLSVPLATDSFSPALRFWWKSSVGSAFAVEIGAFPDTTRPVDTLVGDDSWRSYAYCLPPWTHGNVLDLAFFPATADSTIATELVVEDVELFSDDRCGDSPELLDPGFDSAPNRWHGVSDLGSQTTGESITLRDDAELARTGRGVLEMTYTANDQLLRFETWLLVPESFENRGPQLVFFSKVPADAPMVVSSFLGKSTRPTDELLPGDLWRSNEVCLPPEWAGRWFRFQLRIGPSRFEPFTTFDPPMRVFVDDFELRTSEACKAE